MHYSLLAVNFSEENMEQYYEGLEVEEYREYITQEDVEHIKGYIKKGSGDTLENIKDYYGAISSGKDEKGYYYTTDRNENGKWDWYSLGGRWKDYLLLKDGTTADEAMKKEIDFEGMINEQKKDYIDLYKEGTKKENRLKRITDKHFNNKFDIQPNETEEEYCNRKISICTYAILDEYGEWYEKSHNYEWNDETAREKAEEKWEKFFRDFISKLNDEDMISIIDFHC